MEGFQPLKGVYTGESIPRSMSVKIINILKDDTFPEILELFRQASPGEVIFVLPKNSKVFRKEDHFAAFASEANGADKTISILSSSPDINSWARRYKFNVISPSKPVSPSKMDTKPVEKSAVLASAPPPADDDIQDISEDAYQSDVPMTSDETMGIAGQDDTEDEVNPLHGMHVEDADGPVDVDADKSGDTDEPTAEELSTESDLVFAPAEAVHAELTAALDSVGPQASRKTVPVSGGVGKPAKLSITRPDDSPDYIDAVWRDKVSKNAQEQPVAAKKNSKGLLSFLPRLSRPKLPSGKGLPKKITTSIMVASLVLLGSIVYLTTGSAKVSVTPVSRPLSIQPISVQASDVFSSVDANFAKIPGQMTEISKTVTREMTATGQRDVASKARGTLTVSNTFSGAPQTLIATTRFESSGGLIFRTLQTVTVPGSTVKNGTVVPGTVTVQVIADKPGAQYNLPAGTFTIPAFKEKGDTERYAKFTATSDMAFTGGANGPSAVVMQADIDNAQKAATDAVIEQITTAFNEQASGLMLLDGVRPTIGEIVSSARVDDAASTVSVTVSGTLKTVAFRKEDLDTLIREIILKKEHLAVLSDKLELKYSDILFKPDLSVLVFTVSISGTGYAPVDQDAIIHDVLGMKGDEIRNYFRSREGVESAAVTLSPFWVRSVPKNAEKVHLEVNYETPVQ